jgi:hypothetical protein
MNDNNLDIDEMIIDDDECFFLKKIFGWDSWRPIFAYSKHDRATLSARFDDTREWRCSVPVSNNVSFDLFANGCTVLTAGVGVICTRHEKTVGLIGSR